MRRSGARTLEIHAPPNPPRLLDVEVEYVEAAPDAPPFDAPVIALSPPKTICAAPQTPASAMAKLMVDDGIGAVVIVDDERRAVGVLSKSDLLAGACVDAAWGDVTAAERMTRSPRTIRIDAPTWELAVVMAYDGVHHVPLVDEDRRVVGMTTSMDIVRWVAMRSGWAIPRRPSSVPGAH